MADLVRVTRRLPRNTVAAYCDEAHRPLVAALFDGIEAIAREVGATFKAGENFNYLGMLFSFSVENGDILVTRPVVQGDAPFGTDRDIGPIVAIALRQLELAQQLGLPAEECRMFDRVAVEVGSLAAPRVWLSRTDPGPYDTGWLLAVEGSEGNTPLMEMTAAVLVAQRPELAGVLAFPPGFSAVFEGSQLEAVLAPDGSVVASTRN